MKNNIKQTQENLFVIIDGNHLIHRAYYAIQNPLINSKGEQTNAIFGFAGMLMNIIEIERPQYIAMTFDEKAPTFRHEAYKEYKGTRKKSPDELKNQIPRIHDLVKAFNMPIFSKVGYEADDLMGTLAVKAEKEGLTTYIVTADMDTFQLVTDNVFVASPFKGYREAILFDSEKVYKKHGIYPDKVIDYKALVGDCGDNIKGVNGIGPKGAIQLLDQYKTLDGIYDHIDKIPQKVKEKLINGRESAFFSKMLATIITDVECDFSKKNVLIDRLDYLGLDRFFEDIESKSLRNRLRKLMPEGKQVAEDQMSLF